MSNESRLIKDWNVKDVNRMRNIISKRYNDSINTQVGYSKGCEDHEEGSIWEEKGKTWTIKNGIKQTVTKLDKLKESFHLPLVCPKCNKHMKSFKVNRTMWSIHKMCLDCVIDMEANLKKEGKFEEYSSNMIKENIKSHITDLENILNDMILNPIEVESFVTEDGDLELWKGNGYDKKEIIKNLQEYIQKLNNLITENTPNDTI